MTPAQIELRAACTAADIADRAFEAACNAAGFRSRWDYCPRRHAVPAIDAARAVKHAADERMHRAFVAMRAESRNAA